MTPDKADALRALHVPGDPLVLVNVWDAVSARVVAAQPGCRALATASWSIAAAHGFPDGEHVPRELALAAIERIVAVTDLPVTADLEGGYADAGETARLAAGVGAAGCNLEDGTRDPAQPLRPADEATERVASAVASGMVVNARTDAFLAGVEGALDLAIARGRAFLDAGAACVFVPGVSDAETIRALVDALGHVSVFASPSSPPMAELAALGVCRVSFGPGPLGLVSTALAEAAASLLGGGAYPAALAHRP